MIAVPMAVAAGEPVVLKPLAASQSRTVESGLTLEDLPTR